MITIEDKKWNLIEYKDDKDVFESLLNKFKQEVTSTDLSYVDYRDEFNDKQIQEAIHNWWYFDDIYDSWELFDTYDYYFKEVFTYEELDYINEEWKWIRDDMIEYMHNVDKSNPERDLLRNTGTKQLWYYTWLEVYDWNLKDLKDQLKRLWIQVTWNEDSILNLHWWNYYGWELQIFFRPDLEDLFKAIKESNWKQYIEFTDPCIWLTDASWGSWWYSDFIWTIKLPFEPKNIFVEREWPWYSLLEVYGTNEIWDSKWEIIEAKRKLQSETNPEVERYSKWDSDLKKWICHIDDPRFKSHDMEYTMDWLCGWRCKKCWKTILD